MVTTRLSESQRSELVARFEQGVGTAELARAFDCSTTTVTRAARAALGEAAYEALKQRRARKASTAPAAGPEAVVQAVPPPAGARAAGDTDTLSAGASRRPPLKAEAGAEATAAPSPAPLPDELDEDDIDDDEEGVPSTLAIDDAEDFSGSDDEEEEDEDVLDEDERLEGDDGTPFIAITPVHMVDDHAVCRPEPLASAPFSSSAYMLVDKTVELQSRPLRDFPELGQLPEEERERQALVIFINPRQAKRQCGRSQRVIKLPDPGLLVRTAPYLLAQGISRVVVEGTLYALPGS